MRSTHFVHRYPPALGGAEAWLGRLCRALATDGDDVHVWTTTALDLSAFWANGYAELPPGRTVEDGVTVHRFTPSLRGLGRKYLLKVASLVPLRRWQANVLPWTPQSFTMRRALFTDTAKPDVVHASAFPYASILEYARLYARRHDVPFVLTPFVHLGDLADPTNHIRRVYTAPYLRRLLLAADRVLVQTPTEADAVAGMGVRSERVILQGLGVDPAECTGGNRDALRQTWGVIDEVVIGHLANQSYEKGTVDLLAAAALAHERGARFKLVLAGSIMPNFDSVWRTYQSHGWLIQAGLLSDAQRRDFFAGIDAFALPSRSDSFGLVFLEAWANKVPVVGYRAGGVVDVIRHEHDGLLVKCGDLDALAQALTVFLNDADRRTAWGRAGHARLATEFAWADKIATAKKALFSW